MGARLSCIFDDGKAVKVLSVFLLLRSLYCQVLMSFTGVNEDAGVWKKRCQWFVYSYRDELAECLPNVK